jgi:hypothetical protein
LTPRIAEHRERPLGGVVVDGTEDVLECDASCGGDSLCLEVGVAYGDVRVEPGR